MAAEGGAEGGSRPAAGRTRADRQPSPSPSASERRPVRVDDRHAERQLLRPQRHQPLAELRQEPPALVAAHLLEQALLVELGQERDVALDRERVARASPASRRHVAETRPAAAPRPRARRTGCRPGRSGSTSLSKPNSSSTASNDPVRREGALVGEPRHVRERAARPEHAADLAQGGLARFGDELQHERRHRRIERAVIERQLGRERHVTIEPRPGPSGTRSATSALGRARSSPVTRRSP